MSAESRRVTKTESWPEWEGEVINGVFPLHRFLGESNHSAVFLTEHEPENLGAAAIKLVPADVVQTEAQLVQWGAAAALSHPNLMRIMDVGRCQLAGRGFLFVVMEYADQTLAQILPKRALSLEEVTELLVPTLEALSHLHRNQLVHGQLKPSNFLVVGDRLKLATDTIRPMGNSVAGFVRATPYDPPELQEGAISAAGDIWGLGISLAEALTQRAPTWLDGRAETISIPGTLPAQFADMVRNCLSRDPSHRPTVPDLLSQYKPPVPAQVATVEKMPTRDPPSGLAKSPQEGAVNPASAESLATTFEGATAEVAAAPSRRRPYTVAAAAAAVLALTLAGWISLRLSRGHSDARQVGPIAADAMPAAGRRVFAGAGPQMTSTPVAAANVAALAPAKHETEITTLASESSTAREVSAVKSSPSEAARSATALQQVTPDVPKRIRETIHGHIGVTVRVLVDPSGNVVGQFLENAGPSRYFARIAGDAAGEWRFSPSDNPASRVWLLRFGFDRTGSAVEATAR